MSAEIVSQNTPEWHALRCGKVTASRVADIMRKTKSGDSKMRARYLGELVAERLSGVQHTGFKSADMEWGQQTEAQARDLYSLLYDATMTPAAFVDHPLIAMCGASPDHLVNDDGLIEVKCPATHTHIEQLLGGPVDPDYIKQMQWQIACTGRAWCDFCSYDPRMPPEMQLFVQRFERDDVMIRDMEKQVTDFLAEVDATVAKLRAQYAQSEAA